MSAGENRFNPENLDALEAALDEVEKSDGGRSPLVFTGEGKFFSNGLDLVGLYENALERLRTGGPKEVKG